MDHNTRGKLAAVVALAIGPENCGALLGVNWRWTRDTATRLRVPIWRIGGKSMIPAEALLKAIEREAEAQVLDAPPPLTEEQEVNELAQRLGLVLTKGAAR